MAGENELRSISGLSIKTDDSVTLAARARWRNAELHDRCSMSDMENMKAAFQEAYKNKMTELEFRLMLKSVLDVDYDDEAYKILFMKVCS